MNVLHERPAAVRLLGGASKAAVLAALRESAASLAEMARRTGMSKSSLRAALAGLTEAGVVERRADGTFLLAPDARRLVDAIMHLDERASSEAAESLERHRGEWAALDEGYRVLAADADPRALVRQIREEQLRPARVLRIPEEGERIVGATGG